MAVNVYGIDLNWKPPTEKESHSTTYFEYEIPSVLEDELSKMVENRLGRFYQECQCDRCKEERKNKK